MPGVRRSAMLGVLVLLALAANCRSEHSRPRAKIVRDAPGGTAPAMSGVAFSKDGSCWGLARRSLEVIAIDPPCTVAPPKNLPAFTEFVRVSPGLDALAYTTDRYKTVVTTDIEGAREVRRFSTTGDVGVNGLAVSSKYVAYAVGDDVRWRDRVIVAERATGRVIATREYSLAAKNVAMSFAEIRKRACLAISQKNEVEVICGLGESSNSVWHFKTRDFLFPLQSVALGRDGIAFSGRTAGHFLCPWNGKCARLPTNGAMYESADMTFSSDGAFLADVNQGSGYAVLYELESDKP